MPIGIHRAVAATINDGRLTLANAVIFTVPPHDIANVRHVAPLGVSLLVSPCHSHGKNCGAHNGSEHKRQFDDERCHGKQGSMITRLGWVRSCNDIMLPDMKLDLPKKLRQLDMLAAILRACQLLRVAFRVFVGDYLRWSRPRVQIAKAAITGEYVTQMVARLECAVLAVPVRSALVDINDRAPRGIAKGMAWRSSIRRRR
jgi:hypothetical protein